MSIARVFPTRAVSNHCFFRPFSYATLFGFVAFLASSSVLAASINYGNFGPVPPGVSYLQVTESSGSDPVPLYGPPDPLLPGQALDFEPKNFVATTQNGGADITDGQLNFTVMGASNQFGSIGIGSLSLFEGGDYTLFGPGGPGTAVGAGAIIRATVTHVNGTLIAPLDLPPVNASFSDALPGATISAPWSLGIFMDIGSPVAALYGPNSVATKVEVAINNTLVASSEPNTTALIAKKEFRIDITPDPLGEIPEPTSLVIFATMLGLVGYSARRRDW
jgi:hypothetical protein